MFILYNLQYPYRFNAHYIQIKATNASHINLFIT